MRPPPRPTPPPAKSPDMGVESKVVPTESDGSGARQTPSWTLTFGAKYDMVRSRTPWADNTVTELTVTCRDRFAKAYTTILEAGVLPAGDLKLVGTRSPRMDRAYHGESECVEQGKRWAKTASATPHVCLMDFGGALFPRDGWYLGEALDTVVLLRGACGWDALRSKEEMERLEGWSERPEFRDGYGFTEKWGEWGVD